MTGNIVSSYQSFQTSQQFTTPGCQPSEPRRFALRGQAAKILVKRRLDVCQSKPPMAFSGAPRRPH
jgi:hypothetical protein